MNVLRLLECSANGSKRARLEELHGTSRTFGLEDFVW